MNIMNRHKIHTYMSMNHGHMHMYMLYAYNMPMCTLIHHMCAGSSVDMVTRGIHCIQPFLYRCIYILSHMTYVLVGVLTLLE